MNTDDDGDDIMLSATNQSQFTQSLLLFVRSFFSPPASRPLSPCYPCSPHFHITTIQSQTQSGRRYTPHLTRFYASVPPEALIFLAKGSLEQLGVKCKMGPAMEGGAQRLRVGGYDRRKVMFKGWVEIERFAYGGTEGSFCMMQRDEVRPFPVLSLSVPQG